MSGFGVSGTGMIVLESMGGLFHMICFAFGVLCVLVVCGNLIYGQGLCCLGQGCFVFVEFVDMDIIYQPS